MKKFNYIFGLLLILSIASIIIDWRVDGFDFFKAQDYKFYFQSWISFAGATFALIMSVTTFILYKRGNIPSLKFVSLSFLLISFAYGIIGYHTSYCEVCSNLSLCAASHNYSDFTTLISLIIFIMIILIRNTKFNLYLIKIFAYGLILATILMITILFLSINYIEVPDIIPYVFSEINLQGFVFVFPALFTMLIFIYFKKTYNITPILSFVFLLIFLSFIPQAYHILSCTDCHNMECSEFYDVSGLLMFMAIGLIFYSLHLQLKDRVE